MSGTTKDDEQNHYFCGKCRMQIDYLKSDEPTIPCPECGYVHKDRRLSDVPSEIKVDLKTYS